MPWKQRKSRARPQPSTSFSLEHRNVETPETSFIQSFAVCNHKTTVMFFMCMLQLQPAANALEMWISCSSCCFYLPHWTCPFAQQRFTHCLWHQCAGMGWAMRMHCTTGGASFAKLKDLCRLPYLHLTATPTPWTQFARAWMKPTHTAKRLITNNSSQSCVVSPLFPCCAKCR